jgi:regulator of PEP synthase PpsR (kinase-PPPase family)
MPNQKSLFFKLIKCQECGANYRKIQDRQKINYICQNYSTKKGCVRNLIRQDTLIKFIKTYCELKKIEYIESYNFIKNIVSEIRVEEGEECFSIIYKDGSIANNKPNGSFNFV